MADLDQDVQEFITAFGASTDPELWKALITEEFKELREAYAALQKEMADVAYVITGAMLVGATEEELESLITELDLKIMEGVASIQPGIGDKVWAAVHKSNMSKLGEDGKPIRREDGKILKGPNYKAPDILEIVTNEGTSSV